MKELLQRQQFNPGFLGIFVNPFYIARRELRRFVERLAPSLSGSFLDVGCGTKPYEKLFTKVDHYLGMEYGPAENTKSSKADVHYEGEHFPFEDARFDSVFSSETLEHVFTPELFITEIARVLKRGGNLLLTVPFLWDEHEQPHDFGRYSSFGIRALLERHGFEVIELIKTAPDLRALVQLFNCYLYKKLPFKSYKARLIVYVVLFGPLTLIGLGIAAILPKNPDLYLGNIVLARKL